MSDRSSSALEHFFRLYRLLRPYHGRIYKGIIIGPLIGVFSVVPAYLTKLLFDRVAVGYDLNLLGALVIGIVAFSIASSLAEVALQYYSAYLNIKLENTVQLFFFNHVQHLPYRFFYKRKIGEMASRFQEIKVALGSVHAFLQVVIGQGVYLIVAPIFLFFLNWKLALAAMISVPFSTLAIYLVNQRLRRSWKNVVESHADVEAGQLQMLNQILTIKSLQLEEHGYRKASSQFTGVLGAHLRAQGMSVSLSGFEKIMNVLNVGLLTWLGWRFIAAGEMSVGDYVAFSAYVGYLRNPIMQVIELFTQFQHWGVHMKRVFEYLDVPPEQSPEATKDADPSNDLAFSDDLEFRAVSYRYSFDSDDGDEALRDVSFRIAKGRIAAFVGRSGSGKSTILRLLTRIEQGHKGAICIDGRDIESIPLFSYRRQFGIAWQDADLFHGSLGENLRLGAGEVTREQLDAAVELCCLDEFVASLDEGYDTPIAEKGSTLSSGQRQRVALVRAILRRPSILVLDEALSNLDLVTEATVVERLFAHARRHGMTVLFVTHRIATVRHCDEIHVLSRGRLVDSGTFVYLGANSEEFQRIQGLEEKRLREAT